MFIGCNYSLYWYRSTYGWSRLQTKSFSLVCFKWSRFPYPVAYMHCIVLYQLRTWDTSLDCAGGGRQWRWTESWRWWCNYWFIWASEDSCKKPALVTETVYERPKEWPRDKISTIIHTNMYLDAGIGRLWRGRRLWCWWYTYWESWTLCKHPSYSEAVYMKEQAGKKQKAAIIHVCWCR